MKLLLLFSVVLVAGANAALAGDPIHIEPDPDEQMKPCDTYGPGWYYLPGTTTCVKVSGDVRMQYGATHSHGGRRSN